MITKRPVRTRRTREYIITPEYTTISMRAAKKLKKRVSAVEYRRHLATLSILEKTSRHLAVERNIKPILRKIATTVGKNLGAKYVNFWNFTPDRKGVYIVAAYGMQRQYLKHSRQDPLPLGKAWIGRAMKTGRAWSTSNVQKDPFLPRSWLPAVRKQKYHGLLCVPLKKKKKVTGGMCIYYKNIHQFDSFDMSIATIVANQAATAVENARIFGDLFAERIKTLSIVQSLNDGLIMYDLSGRVIFFNPRAEELLWVRAKQVIGKKIDAALSPKSIYLKNLYRLSLLPDENFKIKEYTTEGPQKLVLAVTRIAVRDQKHRKIGTMQILHDITPEKELEELKTGFISIASHQLRTPLTGIKWSIDALLEQTTGPLNSRQIKRMKQVADITDRSLKLISDLLDAARIEEGKFGYVFATADLAKIVKGILQNLEVLIRERNISLTIARPSGPLPGVNVDKTKLDIAIQNVVDNAIHYSLPGGSIHIDFRVTRESLLLIIRDNGIGIPEKAKGLIFEKFFRAENAILLRPNGSGLGLYIAKSIVEKHNGRIFLAESKLNGGSKFIIELPLNPEKMPRGAIRGI